MTTSLLVDYGRIEQMLRVDEGQLRVTTNTGLGTGSVQVSKGAFVILNTAAAFANPWFISGDGPTEAQGGTGEFKDGERVFDERRSLLFKTLQVVRFFDRKRNVLVYVAYSDRIIEGSPKNSISSVPIMGWAPP